MSLQSIRSIGRNALSLLLSEAVAKVTTFVLYTVVARHLGVSRFGQLSLALTLFYAFQVFSAVGLKNLVIRGVARNRDRTDHYLINGSTIVAVASLLSITILLIFVASMRYSRDTASIIVALSLGLLPYSLSSVCEAVFQAWERMHYIAYINVPMNIATVTVAFFVLSRGYGVHAVVFLLLASYTTTLVIQWYLILKHITKPRLQVDSDFSLHMLKSTGTFFGIDAILAIMASLNVILLSRLATEADVGLYSAATQLMVPITVISHNIVASVFPILCRRFASRAHGITRLTEDLIGLLLAIALPTVICLFFLAPDVLSVVYTHRDFLSASQALRIMVWNLILTPITTVLGHVLVASLREKITLRIVALDTLVNLALGLFLVNQFGLIGAAVAIVLTRIVDFLQHYVSVARFLSRIALGRLARNSVVAVTCMGVLIAMAKSQGILLTIMLACIVYVGVLFTLTIWTAGGVCKLKAGYLHVWSE